MGRRRHGQTDEGIWRRGLDPARRQDRGVGSLVQCRAGGSDRQCRAGVEVREAEMDNRLREIADACWTSFRHQDWNGAIGGCAAIPVAEGMIYIATPGVVGNVT